jgi:hypothetical protein
MANDVECELPWIGKTSDVSSHESSHQHPIDGLVWCFKSFTALFGSENAGYERWMLVTTPAAAKRTISNRMILQS